MITTKKEVPWNRERKDDRSRVEKGLGKGKHGHGSDSAGKWVREEPVSGGQKRGV